MKKQLCISSLVMLLIAACSSLPEPTTPSTIRVVTSDQVTVYGQAYFGKLDTTAPLILLFHQGRSSGRGEYADLAPWLNQAGFRAIAWDQRSGGEIHGATNRTMATMPQETANAYCDAYADLVAALNYVTTQQLAEQVIVWGSSYSAALVFRLAAENPTKVSAVIGFSPASGGPMVNCRARLWAEEVTTAKLVLRPTQEMERSSAVEQRKILSAAGVEFHIVENGIHGSSMLIDSRTQHDMSAARQAVLKWLNKVSGKIPD